MLLAREATTLERHNWDELVARFPSCRIAHKRPWIEWLQACGCGQPLYLVLERDGELVGAVPGLLVRLGLLQLYGSPLPGWQTPAMGPVFDPSQVSTAELVTGRPYFRAAGVEHDVRNANAFEFVFVEIETK